MDPRAAPGSKPGFSARDPGRRAGGRGRRTAGPFPVRYAMTCKPARVSPESAVWTGTGARPGGLCHLLALSLDRSPRPGPGRASSAPSAAGSQQRFER